MTGYSESEVRQIAEDAARHALEGDRHADDVPRDAEGNKLVGFVKIIGSRVAYFILDHWRQAFWVMALLFILGLSVSLFGPWHILYTVVFTLIFGSFTYLTHIRQRVVVMHVGLNKNRMDKFGLFTMSRDKWASYDKEGEANPIETPRGNSLYVINGYNGPTLAASSELYLSPHHRDIEAWAKENAYLDLDKMCMDLMNEIVEHKLKGRVRARAEGVAYMDRGVEAIDRALLNPDLSPELDGEPQPAKDNGDGSDQRAVFVRDGEGGYKRVIREARWPE